MDNSADNRCLSRRVLAHRLGLPVKTLAQWAGKGTGPPYARMGRHARYGISDVIDWETARVDDNARDGAQPATRANHESEPVVDANISAGLISGGSEQ